LKKAARGAAFFYLSGTWPPVDKVADANLLPLPKTLSVLY
jgi:hypothetical protein